MLSPVVFSVLLGFESPRSCKKKKPQKSEHSPKPDRGVWFVQTKIRVSSQKKPNYSMASSCSSRLLTVRAPRVMLLFVLAVALAVAAAAAAVATEGGAATEDQQDTEERDLQSGEAFDGFVAGTVFMGPLGLVVCPVFFFLQIVICPLFGLLGTELGLCD